MPLPQLTAYRHDRRKQALITLSGEIDVDLTPVACCDCNDTPTAPRPAPPHRPVPPAPVLSGDVR
ncbi:hypothetical protein [Streptomyces shaanxiensis]|uniref:Transposase n=1 Tax=Streptomyces shaanxiensis TaxID=653357 RepID=A0ABP7WJ64_9ACTN